MPVEIDRLIDKYHKILAKLPPAKEHQMTGVSREWNELMQRWNAREDYYRNKLAMETAILLIDKELATEQLEKVADYFHKSWCSWMHYLFGQTEDLPDGRVAIPLVTARRWARQMDTDYKDLPEKEKESDRREARGLLEIIKEER